MCNVVGPHACPGRLLDPEGGQRPTRDASVSSNEQGARGPGVELVCQRNAIISFRRPRLPCVLPCGLVFYCRPRTTEDGPWASAERHDASPTHRDGLLPCMPPSGNIRSRSPIALVVVWPDLMGRDCWVAGDPLSGPRRNVGPDLGCGEGKIDPQFPSSEWKRLHLGAVPSKLDGDADLADFVQQVRPWATLSRYGAAAQGRTKRPQSPPAR